MRTGRAKSVTTGARAMVPYGHSQPVLTCAPLRVCTVELQSGERIIDHVLGDPERWAVDFAVGPEATPLIVTKPVALPDACNLTTNLMVTTTVRIYHLTLDSPPCGERPDSTNPVQPYIRQLAFYYPDEALVQHHGGGHEAERGAQGPDGSAPPGSGRSGAIPATIAATGDTGYAMPVGDISELHFGYRVTPDRRFPWRPLHIFDNGRQTCLRLPEEAWYGDLPVLYELDERGEYGMINYVVRDGCMLADRVMMRMVLVLSGGEGGDPIRMLAVRQPGRAR